MRLYAWSLDQIIIARLSVSHIWPQNHWTISGQFFRFTPNVFWLFQEVQNRNIWRKISGQLAKFYFDNGDISLHLVTKQLTYYWNQLFLNFALFFPPTIFFQISKKHLFVIMRNFYFDYSPYPWNLLRYEFTYSYFPTILLTEVSS